MHRVAGRSVPANPNLESIDREADCLQARNIRNECVEQIGTT
jgi:hypothetical protein